MSAVYLKEFFLFIFATLPLFVMIFSGQKSQNIGLVSIVLFGFGLSGVIVSLLHNGIEGTNTQIFFMAICCLLTLIGYFGLKRVSK